MEKCNELFEVRGQVVQRQNLPRLQEYFDFVLKGPRIKKNARRNESSTEMSLEGAFTLSDTCHEYKQKFYPHNLAGNIPINYAAFDPTPLRI